MQWRRRKRFLVVIGSAHHSLLIKHHQDGGGSGSGNEDDGGAPGEVECDHSLGGSAGTYARATQPHHYQPQQQQQRYGGGNNYGNSNGGYGGVRRPNNSARAGGGGGGGYYNNKQPYGHQQRAYGGHDNGGQQPLVTTEKQIFNEEEYTKITTPRQDVLFKKGYLGRKRPPLPTAAAEQDATGGVATDPAAVNHAEHNGEGLEGDPCEGMEEHPQFIYTNGFMDHTGVYYINGSGYEMYDPYTGNIAVIVGPHYGPNGGPPVLAAVPCQPVPLQPLEWFNPPGFLPYITGPCHNGLQRDRRKRYSTDSQNCSPQSSESTGPPGSPHESDEVAPEPHNYPPIYQPPSYVYPGYMFGAPMYNVNGVTVQSTPNQAPSSDVSSGKRRKKKRRRRRKRNGVEDGSEESSSEEKGEEEEPTSVTSQESSLESDSKHSLSSRGGGADSPNLKPRVDLTSNLPPAPAVVVEKLVEPVANQVESHIVNPVVNHVVVNHVNHVEKHDIEPVVEPKLIPQVVQTVQSVVVPQGPLANGIHHKSDRVENDRPIETPKAISTTDKAYENLNGVIETVLVAAEVKPLSNGYAKATEKKEHAQCNGTSEKRNGCVEERRDDNAYERYEDFGDVNGFANGEAEEEWITVKGKGSQGRKAEANGSGNGRHEDRKYPVDLTNGHAKAHKDYRSREENNHRANGVNGKEKAHQRNGERLYKNDKNCNGRVLEEKCTFTKAKQVENLREKQVNGKGRNLNCNKMDGNEKDEEKGKDGQSAEGKERKSSGSSSEGSKTSDSQRKSTEPEDTPTKPNRKDRKPQKPVTPPKTPESVLTATAKPFVSLRPETFIKPVEVSLNPDEFSKEDSLLAALTMSSKPLFPKAATSGATSVQALHVEVTTPRPNVQTLRDLSTKSIPLDVTTTENRVMKDSTPKQGIDLLKNSSQDFLAKETENGTSMRKFDARTGDETNGDKDDVSVAPVAPPRRKKLRPSNKRLSTERAPTPGKLSDSPDDSSSGGSSSPESEESVIECLSSSGICSPEARHAAPGFSSGDDDEEVIYTGKLGLPGLQVAGTIKVNPKKDNEDGDKSTGDDKPVLKEPDEGSGNVNQTNLPRVSNESPEAGDETSQLSESKRDEDRVKEVVEMANEIVGSVIDDSVREALRLRDEKETDATAAEPATIATSPLGITDAVTRWLRSQSPDVLSMPTSEPGDEGSTGDETGDDSEADVEGETDTGSKNLHRNPLPAPSVKSADEKRRRPNCDAASVGDGTSRRVAKLNADNDERGNGDRTRLADAATPPDLDDSLSTDSLPCGEWDLWDCHDGMTNYEREDRRADNASDPSDHILCHAPTHSPGPQSAPLTPEYINLPGQNDAGKYDPLANDTFSSVERSLLESPGVPDRCVDMCDPSVSVAKYYLLGPRPEKTSSPIEDLDVSDPDDNLTSVEGGTYRISLAAELARLEQPLPKSWAVAPIKADRKKCNCRCECSGVPADSGVESGEETSTVPRKKREGQSVFKRRLVGRLRGEGAPFPCGGICCIVQ